MRKLKRNLDFFQVFQVSNTFCLSRQLHTGSRVIVHTHLHKHIHSYTNYAQGRPSVSVLTKWHPLPQQVPPVGAPLIYHTSLYSTHDTGSVCSKLFRYIMFLWGIRARGLRHPTHSAHVFCTLISTQDSLSEDIGTTVSRLSKLQPRLAHSTACSQRPAHTMHWVAQGTLGKDTACVASYHQEPSFPEIWELQVVTANKPKGLLNFLHPFKSKRKGKSRTSRGRCMMMGLANWALWQFQRCATAQPWWWHVIAHLHNGVRQQRATWIRIQLWVPFCQGETWLVIPHNFRILNNVFQSHSSFQGGLPDTTNMCYTELCPWKSLYCCCIHKQKNPWDALLPDAL